MGHWVSIPRVEWGASGLSPPGPLGPAPAAAARPDGLPLPAAGYRGGNIGQGLSRPSHRRLVVSDTPQLLLAHHLKALRLPSFLREYDKLAQQCAAEGVDHPRYLLRLAELELIDREQRMVERRIKEARFPTVKSLDSFEFAAIPSLNKTMVLELARCEYVARRENVIAVGNSGTGKTHIALGLGLAACQKGLSVGFVTAAALVHELIEARDEKSLLSRPDLECNGRGAQRRGWEARSHAQQREHGEHRTFPAASTVADWSPAGFYVWCWRCLLCLRR